MKVFKTQAVLGAYTAIVPEGGFGQIHEVLDHLFPGIMTLGCAAVSSSGVAKEQIALRAPHIKHYVECSVPCTTENWREWYEAAVQFLGDEVVLSEASANQRDLASRAFEHWEKTEAKHHML